MLDPLFPDQIGPYRILRRLGEGGMGFVFEAIRDDIGLCVAIKVLKPQFAADEDLSRRFLNEARAVIQINSPGIVRVFDYGHMADKTPYIVMELLSGQTLAARLREIAGRMSAEEYLRIAHAMSRTLGDAHARSVIHRDLKPDNVMLISEAEGSGRVKLLDFGIAKLAADTRGGQTSTCVLMGTPEYMSPEQCRGSRDVDDRTDIYSLGVILFQMASGRRPFLGPSPGELIGQHQYQAPPSLGKVAAWVPPGLVQLVDCMLQKEPQLRPSILKVSKELALLVADLPEAAAYALSHPTSQTIPPTLVQAAPSGATPQLSGQALPRPRPRLRPLRLWALLGFIGVTGTTGLIMWVKQRRTEPPNIQRQTDDHAAGQSLKRPDSIPIGERLAPSRAAPSRDAAVGVEPDAGPEHRDLADPPDLSFHSSPASPNPINLAETPKPPKLPGSVRPQSQSVEAMLAEAETALEKKNYEWALEVANRPEVLKSAPARAWRVIGLVACRQTDARALSTVSRRLSGAARNPIVEECNKVGISFTDKAIAELAERHRLRDRTKFDLAQYQAHRLFTLRQFTDAIDRAEAALLLSKDPDQRAPLWNIVGMSACYEEDAARINRALSSLATRPELAEDIVTLCLRIGLRRNAAGAFLRPDSGK